MISKDLLELLVCPRCGMPFEEKNKELACSAGHRYEVIDGIPILLLPEEEQTLWVASASLNAGSLCVDDPAFVDTIGGSPEERTEIKRRFASFRSNSARMIDPVVDMMVSQTGGLLYRGVAGKLARYPIPWLRLPDGAGTRLLDIGCGWGRWSAAAAGKGFSVVGLDTSLGAVAAARRVCAQLGHAGAFVVGDSRFLPFRPATFGVVFSYSVLQHFSKAAAAASIREAGRVLKPGGTSMIQMPNALGIRSLQHQARRRFRTARDFEVRYYLPRELTALFEAAVGPTKLSVDGYFGLGIQPSDQDLLPRHYRIVVRASEFLRALSGKIRPLVWFADSLYVMSTKPLTRQATAVPG